MMISQITAENIETAIADIRKNTPAFANIAEAFKELLIQRSCIKTEMTLPEPLFNPDPVRFSQGVSAWLQGSPIPAEDYLQNAVDRLFPVMRKGFPRIAVDLSIFKTAIRPKWKHSLSKICRRNGRSFATGANTILSLWIFENVRNPLCLKQRCSG